MIESHDIRPPESAVTGEAKGCSLHSLVLQPFYDVGGITIYCGDNRKIRCFFQTLAEWWRLWRDHKDRWQEIEALEAWTGHTLRSEQRDTWPASLKELRAKFEAGYTPKGAAQTNLRLDVAERPTMCAWCAR